MPLLLHDIDAILKWMLTFFTKIIPKQSGVPEVLHLAGVCPHFQNKLTKKPQGTEASSKTKSWIIHTYKTLQHYWFC